MNSKRDKILVIVCRKVMIIKLTSLRPYFYDTGEGLLSVIKYVVLADDNGSLFRSFKTRKRSLSKWLFKNLPVHREALSLTGVSLATCSWFSFIIIFWTMQVPFDFKITFPSILWGEGERSFFNGNF